MRLQAESFCSFSVLYGSFFWALLAQLYPVTVETPDLEFDPSTHFYIWNQNPYPFYLPTKKHEIVQITITKKWRKIVAYVQTVLWLANCCPFQYTQNVVTIDMSRVLRKKACSDKVSSQRCLQREQPSDNWRQSSQKAGKWSQKVNSYLYCYPITWIDLSVGHMYNLNVIYPNWMMMMIIHD